MFRTSRGSQGNLKITLNRRFFNSYVCGFYKFYFETDEPKNRREKQC